MLDDVGFTALYREAAQDLVVFFARRTYDADAAADLMAETFARAYLGRRRFRGSSEEEARAWLFGIARRRLAMYIRRGKAERRALRRLGLERPQPVEGECDVRILYTDKRGAKRDAPVDFVSVTGPVRERAGADRRFGLFMGFLPQAWLGYGAVFDPRHCPPEEHPFDPEAIEVIAYDHQGEPIARETGSNVLSAGGRPPCS